MLSRPSAASNSGDELDEELELTEEEMALMEAKKELFSKMLAGGDLDDDDLWQKEGLEDGELAGLLAGSYRAVGCAV